MLNNTSGEAEKVMEPLETAAGKEAGGGEDEGRSLSLKSFSSGVKRQSNGIDVGYSV